MPRFIFKIPNSNQASPPSVDLPSVEAARREAVRAACKMLSDSPDDFWDDGGDWQMTIADESGLTLFTLIFYATNAPAVSARSYNGERRPL